MVCEFAHKEYLELVERNDLFEEEDEQKNIQRPLTKTLWKENEPKKITSFKELQGNTLREGEAEIFGLTEPDNMEIKQTINEILHPSDKLNYQPQSKENEDSEQLVLEIDSVYGIDVNNRSIHYVHSYPSENITKKNLDDKYWQDTSSDNKEDLQFLKSILLPIDEDHNNCRRQILYCCDRFCVLNEKNAPQQLYKFHRRKISAVAVHPNKQLICSCEVSSSFA